jgi:hypothetical protein
MVNFLLEEREDAIMVDTKRAAELQYSEQYGRIEFVVPHRTTFAELAKISPKLFADVIQRLPRGCTACKSGDDFIIRERLEHVLRVDLDSMEVIG